MTTPTTIKNFPAYRLTTAREALGKLQTRLVRAATRLGQPAPVAPVLTVTREFVISRCTECGCSEEGWAGGRCMACKTGYLETRDFLDLALEVAPPVVSGWEFIAVIEPLEGGNLIRQVPGANAEGFDFSAWRTGPIKCDHCNTIRRRTETFLVRADGSLEGYPAGESHQVGRNCLADFLGGKTAESILVSLSFEATIRGIGEEGEGGWGGGGARVYSPFTVLAQTAALVRLDGFVSKKTAEESGGEATSSRVGWLLDPPPFGAQERDRWFRETARCAVTLDDLVRASEAMAWAKSLPGISEFEQNLSLLARQRSVTYSKFGFLCYAIAGYERFLGKTKKTAAFDPTKSGFVGTVGEKLIATVTVDAVFDVETDYGTLHINKFRDAAGNSLVWKTTSQRFEVGKTVTLKGTVKRQEEFRGEKQTELSRCSEVAEGTVLKVPKAKKAPKAKAAPAAAVEQDEEQCPSCGLLGKSIGHKGCPDLTESPIRPHGIKEEIGY